MNMQEKKETNERDFLCWIEHKNEDTALMKEILRTVTHTETQYRNNKKALKTQLRVSRHVISKVRVDGLVSDLRLRCWTPYLPRDTAGPLLPFTSGAELLTAAASGA